MTRFVLAVECDAGVEMNEVRSFVLMWEGH